MTAIKTCRKCLRMLPADAANFLIRKKNRVDGSTYTILTSPCVTCARASAAIRRAENLERDRKRVAAANARSRAIFGRDRGQEYLQARERRAKASGFSSYAEKVAALQIARERRRLMAMLKALAKQMREGAAFSWRWSNPALTAGEAWKLRYAIDQEFRSREIIRLKLRKRHIGLATPVWVDRNALADVYRARPAGHHVDHIVPLKGKTPDGWRISGLNVPWNLRHLPGAKNRERGNLMTAEEVAAIEGGQCFPVREPFANR